MYLTLIVAIVTSKYIFRCSKVSILIENIYIINKFLYSKANILIFLRKIISLPWKISSGNNFLYSKANILIFSSCFSFCTLSSYPNNHWIALCLIKDYPGASICQIQPLYGLKERQAFSPKFIWDVCRTVTLPCPYLTHSVRSVIETWMMWP